MAHTLFWIALVLAAGCGGTGSDRETPRNNQDGGTGGTGGSDGGSFLSAGYPGDVGIANDPAVFFVEDFEATDVSTVINRWDSVALGQDLSLITDVPGTTAPGSKSLLTAVPGGEGVTGVSLYKSLPDQHDTVYVRYYAKYNDQSGYHHSSVWIGGYNPSTAWPQGTAGIRPSGTDFFHSAFEPIGQPGNLEMDFYIYWPGMDCWMPTPSCYGNVFNRDHEPAVTNEEWTCFEHMLKLNTPGQSDGELAIWIDDELVQHLEPGSPSFNRTGVGAWIPDANGTPFPGFNWRGTSDFGVNFIWIDFYVDHGPSSMGWDQLIAATERIGCMASAN